MIKQSHLSKYYHLLLNDTSIKGTNHISKKGLNKLGNNQRDGNARGNLIPITNIQKKVGSITKIGVRGRIYESLKDILENHAQPIQIIKGTLINKSKDKSVFDDENLQKFSHQVKQTKQVVGNYKRKRANPRTKSLESFKNMHSNWPIKNMKTTNIPPTPVLPRENPLQRFQSKVLSLKQYQMSNEDAMFDGVNKNSVGIINNKTYNNSPYSEFRQYRQHHKNYTKEKKQEKSESKPKRIQYQIIKGKSIKKEAIKGQPIQLANPLYPLTTNKTRFRKRKPSAYKNNNKSIDLIQSDFTITPWQFTAEYDNQGK